MRAEIISIGDELTSGQRLDTNSQWLSQRLGELGIPVVYHTTVGDDLGPITRILRQAVERADVVIITGGLGPTADDLTRDGIAEATGCPLALDEAVLAHIHDLFARRKREMPPANRVQAFFPKGSRVIANPHGTAPGIDIDVPREGRPPARIMALPGVPAELREMWYASVEPALIEATGEARTTIRHRQIKCFGVGESDLEQMLPDLIRRGRSPTVGITVHQATITLRITAEGKSAEACYAAMQPTVATIYECLGDLIFGEEDDELQHAVTRMLVQTKQKLVTVEWGSGGLLADWLSEAADATSTYLGGIVVRDERLLTAAAGVPLSLVSQHGVSSIPVVEALARGCRERCGADFALAIGPFPSRDTTLQSSGDVHFALANDRGVQSRSSPHLGHPDILKARATKQALNMLRKALLEQSK